MKNFKNLSARSIYHNFRLIRRNLVYRNAIQQALALSNGLDFVQFHDFLADARQSCDYTRKNPVSRALGSLIHAA